MCAGNFGEGGASNKWDNAIEVSLAKLLFPEPKRYCMWISYVQIKI